jgi:hypothetical protein
MRNNPIPENKALMLSGFLVFAVFVVLSFAEYRIETETDPSRFHLSFPKAEGASLETELCQEGPRRDFSVSAFIESTDEPYFETNTAVRSHDCVIIPVPTPETSPNERPARIRVRATDPDGRVLEIFRML